MLKCEHVFKIGCRKDLTCGRIIRTNFEEKRCGDHNSRAVIQKNNTTKEHAKGALFSAMNPNGGEMEPRIVKQSQATKLKRNGWLITRIE